MLGKKTSVPKKIQLNLVSPTKYDWTEVANEIVKGCYMPYDLTSSLVRYFYLPHDGTYGFKGVSEDLTGD